MVFLVLFILSETSFVQAQFLQSSTKKMETASCVLELDLNQAEQAFLSLESELRKQFLTLAQLRVSLDQSREVAQSRDVFFLTQLKEFKALVLKEYTQEEFDLFFRFAIHLAQLKKEKVEIKTTQKQQAHQALKEVLELQESVNVLKSEGKTPKVFYQESPDAFSMHRQKGYFKFDLGLVFLDDAFGLAYSTQLKELIRKIVNAEDLSDEKALALLQAIKPKFKSGEVKQILEFAALLEGSSLEKWAQKALPRLFIDMNRAPTRLGQKISRILWPVMPVVIDKAYKQTQEFVIRAIQDPQSDDFWTTRSMVRAFRGILQISQKPIAIKTWLSNPAQSRDVIEAKARYLGLKLNEHNYEAWIALVPKSEQKKVEKAIDQFSILRLLRNATEDLSSLPLKALALEALEFVEAPIPPKGVTYMMGSPPDEHKRRGSEDQTEVTLKQPFQFGATKVTQWLFKAIMGDLKLKPWLKPALDRGKATYNHAMDTTPFDDAVKFANELTRLLKTVDPKHPCHYELTTEARWEFMARAGTQTPYSFGGDIDDLKDFAFFVQNSAKYKTSPVAAKLPNGFGIFDVHGSLWERQQDAYLRTLPGGIDPLPLNRETNFLLRRRAVRAGGRESSFHELRSARRTAAIHRDSSFYIGFRLERICQ